MNAEPLLTAIARALAVVKLEAVLIGNAAAALQGAPVTTLDFDFCYRSTKTNEEKLKSLAAELGAQVSHPHAPVSSMTRIEREDAGLQLDFLPDEAIGQNFASLRSRATRMDIAGQLLWVADLADVASSKKKAGRLKDKASLYVIEATIKEKSRAGKTAPKKR